MSTHEVSNDGQEKPAIVSASGPAATEHAPIQAENIQPDPVSPPQPSPPAKTFFGLAQDSRRQRPVFNDDYVERFPEDPYGEETAPNARIWRVYVEEAAAFDENMVGQSRDGLDVMLVFAGLFSAVVTSFLVQVSQNLQADFSQMSALLLHDLLIVQLSLADGATVNITTPSVNPAQNFDPDAIDVWINGLWVVSLVTSLVVALAAVLVKQWLHRYMTFPSGTPELRSHVRQFRFMGFEKWRVRIIVGMLPIIMHVSLMLFFAGLALFYVPLRASLAGTVATITVFVCILYLVSNTIPIIFPQCPYQTPLTDFVHDLCQLVPFGVQSIQHYWFVAYRGLVLSRQQSSAAFSFLEYESRPDVLQSNLRSLSQIESGAVQDAHATLSVDALDWLYHMSSNPTVHTLVSQGIGGLHDESRSYAVTKWKDATDMQRQRDRLVREASQNLDFPDQQWVVERLCRSSLFLSMGDDRQLKDVLGKSGDWDPRIEAAILSRCPWSWSYNYIGFFIRHSEVLMHPLVWEKIGHAVLKQFLGFHEEVNEFTLAGFLGAVRLPSLATSPTLMTGSQVVWTRLHSQVWDTLLRTSLLAPYDNRSGTFIYLYDRTLIAAGGLALSRVLEHRDDMKYADLLLRVVKLTENTETAPRIDFLISVLEKFPDVVVASKESQNSSSPLAHCLHHICSIYSTWSCMPGFHFPELDRFLRTWAGFYSCAQYDSVFSHVRGSYLSTPMMVMGKSLSCGYEEAYRIFNSRGWMGIIFTEWAICGNDDANIHQIFVGYIKGFDMVPDSTRRKFCEYLHQPQELTLVFMLMAAMGFSWPWAPPNLSEHVVKLAKICPTHTSWRDCDAALKAILAWGQTPDQKIPLFPWPSSLQSLNSTEAFRKYPLVEWTARRFADPDVQKRLKEALDVLHEVLDNAEHVDGVLMPDLENSTSMST